MPKSLYTPYRRNVISRLAIVWILFLPLSGCAYLGPLVSDINLISIQEEQTLGEQISAQIASEMPLVDDAKLSSRVSYLGERLVNQLPRKDFDYQFHVVNDPTPNAFTIPGGIIYAQTGLLDFVDDDDELAAVLAHEIAHAYERHPTKSLTRSYGFNYLVGLLFKEEPGKLKKMGLELAAGTVLNAYGRDDEREADRIAFSLLKSSGFRTDGLLRFFKKMQQNNPAEAPIPFLSTHPATSERIAYLEELEKTQGRVLVSETAL